MPLSTTTPIDIYKTLTQAFDAGNHEAALMLSSIAKTAWSSHWPYILIIIVLVLLAKFLERGVGSVIYNILYFGALGLVVAVMGFDIIFNIYFEIIAALVYVFSFRITGVILRELRHQSRNIR